MGQFSKSWEELNISDNYIFCKVMKNKLLCAELLEILLGFKVKDISYIESEHPIDDYYQTRGIRMDVYVEGTDKIYDIEMQTGDSNSQCTIHNSQYLIYLLLRAADLAIQKS